MTDEPTQAPTQNTPAPQGDDQNTKSGPRSIVAKNAGIVAGSVRIASFRGRPMILRRQPYPHFVPLRKEEFDSIAYPLLGGVTRGRIGDVFAYVANTAEDLTANDRFILFGLGDAQHDADQIDNYYEGAQTQIWDMERLEFVDDIDPEQAIWRSPYGTLPVTAPPATAPAPPLQAPDRPRLPFIMSLAGNDTGLYDDIMQSLAPLVMEQKPDGVIWWVGDGANGKSTLMDAIYRIFPGQLASITVKRLTDGRDTPSLNGTLANVVKESSEGRIEDTEIYKAIGTHENFRVHKFHSQDDVEIRGNLHHIFSGNSVPLFNDKGWSARRRTFVVPFTQRFESDPMFEKRTFTPEFFGQLITEMCRYAVQLRKQGYRYKWSGATLAAKLEYDTDANNAEEYAKEIIAQGVVAFESFNPLRMDYENYCADNGYVVLGLNNLRRAMATVGFERFSLKASDDSGEVHVRKIYRLKGIGNPTLQSLGMNRPGLFTTPGFEPEEVTVPTFQNPPDDDGPETTTTTTKSILDGRW